MELSEIKIQQLQRMESFGNCFSQRIGLTKSRQLSDHYSGSTCLKQYFKIFLDDCERSGQRFASTEMSVFLSENQKLKTQIAFLNHVGFCNSKGLSDNFKVFFEKKLNINYDASATFCFRIWWMN